MLKKSETFTAILATWDLPVTNGGLSLTTQAATDLVREILPNVRVRVPDRPNDTWCYDLSDGWILKLYHWPKTPFKNIKPIIASVSIPIPLPGPPSAPTYIEDGMVYRVPYQLEVETDEDYAKLLLHFIPAEKVRQFLAQGARR
jgi:hypothetical protein